MTNTLIEHRFIFMRKLLVVALAAPALLFGTVAAEDVAFAPCGDDLKHPVLAAGDTLSETPSGEEFFQFYVDPTVTEKGRVSVSATLEWETFVNDWDLSLVDTVTAGFQPLDPAIESATYSARGDCKLITVGPIDFNAPVPELGMTLNVTVN
jgi:hypothetical protein